MVLLVVRLELRWVVKSNPGGPTILDVAVKWELVSEHMFLPHFLRFHALHKIDAPGLRALVPQLCTIECVNDLFGFWVQVLLRKLFDVPSDGDCSRFEFKTGVSFNVVSWKFVDYASKLFRSHEVVKVAT